MTKRSVRVVASDDCGVTVGGVEHHPHEGETVSVAGSLGVDDLGLMCQLTELESQMDALKDAEDPHQIVGVIDDMMQRFIIPWPARFGSNKDSLRTLLLRS